MSAPVGDMLAHDGPAAPWPVFHLEILVRGERAVVSKLFPLKVFGIAFFYNISSHFGAE